MSRARHFSLNSCQAAAPQSKNSSRTSTLTCARQAIACERAVKLFFKNLKRKVLTAVAVLLGLAFMRELEETIAHDQFYLRVR